MIIKHIDAKAGSQKPDRYARGLARYMGDANAPPYRAYDPVEDFAQTLSAYIEDDQPKTMVAPRERVLFKAGVTNGSGLDWGTALADMDMRLAKRSRRIKKPVRHVVLSYREGENPSEADCAEAVKILANELKCERALTLWAAHIDTDNVHIHAMFITVDPDTGTSTGFGLEADGQSRYKEAMQRAIARIDHAQNLTPEVGARYELIGDQVKAKADVPAGPKRRAPLRQHILDSEKRSGIASFTRIAQEVAAPIIESGQSWVDVHQRLAEVGMGIRPAGHGGELYAGNNHVKLSNVDRALTWSKLLKTDRLGPYTEPPSDIEFTPYVPRILDVWRAEAWLERRENKHQLSKAVGEELEKIMACRIALRVRLNFEIAQRREDLESLDGDPVMCKNLLSAWQRLAAEAKKKLDAKFKARMAASRALRGNELDDEAEEFDIKRYNWFCGAVLNTSFFEDLELGPKPLFITGYRHKDMGDRVDYYNTEGRRSRVPSFTDDGTIIWFNDESETSAMAALTIAKRRSDEVFVYGNQAHVKRCRRAAKTLGIEVKVISVVEGKWRERKHHWERLQRQKAVVESVRTAIYQHLKSTLHAQAVAQGPEPKVKTLAERPLATELAKAPPEPIRQRSRVRQPQIQMPGPEIEW